MKSKWNICLSIIILLPFFFPQTDARAQSLDAGTTFPDSAILSIAAKNRLVGADDANEIRQYKDIVASHYDDMLNRLQNANLDNDGQLAQRLIAERDGQLYDLEAQANLLDAGRQRRNNNTWLRKAARGVGRVLRFGGKAAGDALSGTMTATGKLTQYVIDDVAPQVIEEVASRGGDILLSGGTLQGGALRTLLKQTFIRRVKNDAKDFALYQFSKIIQRNQSQADAKAIVSQITDEAVDPFAGIPSATAAASAVIQVGPQVQPMQDDPHDLDSELDDPSMGSLDDDSGAVVVGGISSDPNDPAGGSGITETRPVAFRNAGTESATIRVETYQAPQGAGGTRPTASTVVTPGGNSSALLELPLGTYTFCYEWQLDEDVDGDGYFDHKHALTAPFSLTSNHSKNADNAVQVSFSAPGNQAKRGRCGENLPDTGNQSPISANQGSHTYRAVITDEKNGAQETKVIPITFQFDEGGVLMIEENVQSYYSKIADLTYQKTDDYWIVTLYFNENGWTAKLTSGEFGVSATINATLQ